MANPRMGRQRSNVGGMGALPRPSTPALVVIAIVAVLAVGFLAGTQGPDAVAIIVAVAGGVLFLVQPFIGVVLVTATVPLETLLSFGSGTTATKLLGVAVAGAWGLQKLLRGTSWQPIFGSSFFWSAASFIALALLSTLWATVPRVTVGGVVQLVQLFVLALLILDLVRSWDRADLLAKGLLIGAGVAAFLTVEQYFFGGYKRAGDEISGGVDATAVVLLTVVPLAFYLLRSRQTKLWQVLGFVYIGLAVLAVMVTFSRGNMLLLPPLLFALSWHTLRSRNGRRWLLVLATGCAILGAFVVPWDRLTERAETITPYLQKTVPTTEGTEGSSGRGYHMKVGLAIARDHPLLGVGYLNYGWLFLQQYQFTVPGSSKVYENPRSPHSSNIGILADLGIVGETLWLLLLGLAAWGVLRAWRLTRSDGDSRPHALAQAVTYSLMLHVVAYGWYLPNQREKIFWVVLGLSAVVAGLARTRIGEAQPRRSTPRAGPWTYVDETVGHAETS